MIFIDIRGIKIDEEFLFRIEISRKVRKLTVDNEVVTKRRAHLQEHGHKIANRVNHSHKQGASPLLNKLFTKSYLTLMAKIMTNPIYRR